jgi:hypothetical protein
MPQKEPLKTPQDHPRGGCERAITERLRHWEQLRSDRAATNDTTTTGADGEHPTTSDDT